MTATRTNKLANPATLIFLALVGLTLASWALGRSTAPAAGITLGVLLMALLKAQLVADWFMGLRDVSGIWRWVISLWLVLIASVLLVTFYLTSGV